MSLQWVAENILGFLYQYPIDVLPSQFASEAEVLFNVFDHGCSRIRLNVIHLVPYGVATEIADHSVCPWIRSIEYIADVLRMVTRFGRSSGKERVAEVILEVLDRRQLWKDERKWDSNIVTSFVEGENFEQK